MGKQVRQPKLNEIDWNLLWQSARKEKSWKKKGPDDWDNKAASFARRNAHSIYNRLFLELLQPEKDWTVLDVGCGPGTLAIPLAQHVRHVSAVDFSPKMLEVIKKEVREKGIRNLSTHELSWADDWQKHGIDPHDVAIASRSLSVQDLRSSLEKLNRFAKKKVAVSDRVGYGPFDPAAFEAVGRELKTGPDYIYTVNILYQMGIHAEVNFIRLKNSHRYSSFPEALDNYSWMFHDLSGDEQKRLEEYVRSIASNPPDGAVELLPEHITTWAFISWTPP